MSKNTKTVIIVILSVVVLGGLACGGFFLMFARNVNPDLLKEARAFGQESSELQCEKAALEKASNCSKIDIFCGMRVQTFSISCLTSAPPSPGFCDRMGISSNDNPYEQSAAGSRWAEQECQKTMSGKPACRYVLSASAQHCSTKKSNQ